MKVVNAVTPLWRPAVTFDLSFKYGCRNGTFDCDRFSVEQNWKVFVVRHPAVPGKLDLLGLNVLSQWFHSVALLRETQSTALSIELNCVRFILLLD